MSTTYASANPFHCGGETFIPIKDSTLDVAT